MLKRAWVIKRIICETFCTNCILISKHLRSKTQYLFINTFIVLKSRKIIMFPEISFNLWLKTLLFFTHHPKTTYTYFLCKTWKIFIGLWLEYSGLPTHPVYTLCWVSVFYIRSEALRQRTVIFTTLKGNQIPFYVTTIKVVKRSRRGYNRTSRPPCIHKVIG